MFSTCRILSVSGTFAGATSALHLFRYRNLLSEWSRVEVSIGRCLAERELSRRAERELSRDAVDGQAGSILRKAQATAGRNDVRACARWSVRVGLHALNGARLISVRHQVFAA